MNVYTDGSAMMWGMGWGGALLVVLLVLCVAALAKYLYFDKRQ